MWNWNQKFSNFFSGFVRLSLSILILLGTVTQVVGAGDDPEGAPPEQTPTDPGEMLNRIVMIVGDRPVTELDIEGAMEGVRAGRSGNRKRGTRAEDQALDDLVVRSIVEREAEKESIIISDTRIQNEIDRRKELSGINSDKVFRQEVEKNTGMAFEVWIDDMRFQLKKRHLIQLMVSVPRPSDAEVERFYRQNRNKIGVEVSFREMILRPKNSSIQEERRISNLAKDLRKKVASNPNNFASLARNTPENVSPLRYRGGLQPYTGIQEVAARHQMLAGLLFSMRNGEVSGVYRDPNGNYLFAQLLGKRPVPLDSVGEMIRQRLYFEKEEEAFDTWIDSKMKEISIVCLVPDVCSGIETKKGGYYPGSERGGPPGRGPGPGGQGRKQGRR